MSVKADLIHFSADEPVAPGHVHRYASTRRFLVAWTRAAHDGDPVSVTRGEEYFLLLPDAAAEVGWGISETAGDGERGATTRHSVLAPARSVVVVPAGMTTVRLEGAGRFIRLFAPAVEELSAVTTESNTNIQTSADLLPLFPGFSRPATGPLVYKLDDLPNSPGMPRAKLFQSATMSINWVEYQGPRERTSLSPHSHQNFEQGSLALEGQFIHHFRSPWGRDANQWREDEHVKADSDSLAIIPPKLVHTTEGVGPGPHLLIDIFAPPRRDFIAKGQVLNAVDYVDALPLVALGGHARYVPHVSAELD
jgi:mannose-6-phosphate isomerase-like protein (cupin superfamily)